MTILEGPQQYCEIWYFRDNQHKGKHLFSPYSYIKLLHVQQLLTNHEI